MKMISKKVSPISYVRYDLEIENNHNFIANGIVIHNSFAGYIYSYPKRTYANNLLGKIAKCFYSVKDMLLAPKRIVMMRSKNCWKSFTKPMFIKEQMKWVMPKKHNWELALEHDPLIVEILKIFPDHLIYGEIFGPIQKHYTYGHIVNNLPGPCHNKVQFRIFEIITPEGERIDGPKLLEALYPFHHFMVPMPIYESKTLPSLEELDNIANDKSLVCDADHRAEGVVVSFYDENDHLILKSKLVGSKYLLDEYQL